MVIMKKLSAILVSSLIWSQFVYADDAIYLNQNDKAPYSGYLLSEDKIKELRNNTIERDGFKAINDSLTKQLSLVQQDSSLKDQKVNLLLDQNDKLAKTAYADRELNTWERVAYFVGGVLITGFAIYGVHQIYGSH